MASDIHLTNADTTLRQNVSHHTQPQPVFIPVSFTYFRVLEQQS